MDGIITEDQKMPSDLAQSKTSGAHLTITTKFRADGIEGGNSKIDRLWDRAPGNDLHTPALPPNTSSPYNAVVNKFFKRAVQPAP